MRALGAQEILCGKMPGRWGNFPVHILSTSKYNGSRPQGKKSIHNPNCQVTNPRIQRHTLLAYKYEAFTSLGIEPSGGSVTQQWTQFLLPGTISIFTAAIAYFCGVRLFRLPFQAHQPAIRKWYAGFNQTGNPRRSWFVLYLHYSSSWLVVVHELGHLHWRTYWLYGWERVWGKWSQWFSWDLKNQWLLLDRIQYYLKLILSELCRLTGWP